jgi:fatty acid elongase 3
MRLLVEHGSGYVGSRSDFFNVLTDSNDIGMQWKKYLTTMQIAQFIIDLFAVYFGSKLLRSELLSVAEPCLAYSHFVYAYYRDTLPVMGNCAGTETAALFGCGLLTSYLGLFINFYIQTYKAPVKRDGRIANGTANGKANGDL